MTWRYPLARDVVPGMKIQHPTTKQPAEVLGRTEVYRLTQRVSILLRLPGSVVMDFYDTDSVAVEMTADEVAALGGGR